MSTQQASGAHHEDERRRNPAKGLAQSLPDPSDDFAFCACRGDEEDGNGYALPCDDLGHIAFFAAKKAKRNLALMAVADFAIRQCGLLLSGAEGLAIAAHTRQSLTRRRGGRS